MDMRAFVRHISPPFLLTILLKLCDRFGFIRRSHVWVGWYPRFKDVPSVGKGFRSETWRQSAVANTQQLLASSRDPGYLPTGVDEGAVLLSVMAAVVSRDNGGRVRVLDFGGGPGIGYAYLLSTVVERSVMDYHVVELEQACEDGSGLFEQDRRVHFHASQARYVLLSDLPAGDFPSYATALNNMPGSLIPEWFLNVNEILETMAQSGYTLIFRSTQQAVYRQGNFPEELKLPGGHCSALLFARSS